MLRASQKSEVRSNIKSGSIGVIRWGAGEGKWGSRGDGELEKYLVMVEDGTFFYTELNGFDIIPCPVEYLRNQDLRKDTTKDS